MAKSSVRGARAACNPATALARIGNTTKDNRDIRDNRAAWDAAMSRHEAARRAKDVFATATLEPVASKFGHWAASNGGGKDNPHLVRFNAAKVRWGRLADSEYDCAKALMAMPAPDLRAVHWKVSQLRELAADDFAAPPEEFDIVLSDMSRFMGDAIELVLA